MTPPGGVHIRVPATSANLGPGFDALGLALAIHDDVHVEPADSGLTVHVEGEGAGELPGDERHLVARAALAAFDAAGVPAPGFRLRCVNRIPQARGLGSSAAAVCAGVLAAGALLPEPFDPPTAVAIAADLEGHADNVAACLLGGLTVAWTEDGRHRAVRLEPARQLRVTVLVPPHRAETVAARRLLPATVPHADAAAGSGRAALLVHALTAEPGLLMPATLDWLHQPYRASAMPETAGLVELLRANGVPAVVSGAGPAVLAFDVGASVGGLVPAGWTELRPEIERRGARVLPAAD